MGRGTEYNDLINVMRPHVSSFDSGRPSNFYLASDSLRLEKRLDAQVKGYQYAVSSHLITPAVTSIQWKYHADSALGSSSNPTIQDVQNYVKIVKQQMRSGVILDVGTIETLSQLLINCSILPEKDVKLLKSLASETEEDAPAIKRDKTSYNLRVQFIAFEWTKIMAMNYWMDNYYIPNELVWKPDAFVFMSSMAYFFQEANMSEYFRICVNHFTIDWKNKQTLPIELTTDEDDKALQWRVKQSLFWSMIQTVHNHKEYVERMVNILMDMMASLIFRSEELHFAKDFGLLFDILLPVARTIGSDCLKRVQRDIISKARYRYPDLALAAFLNNSSEFSEFFRYDIVQFISSKLYGPKLPTSNSEIDFFLYLTHLKVIPFVTTGEDKEEDDIEKSLGQFINRYRFYVIIIVHVATNLFPIDSEASIEEHVKQAVAKFITRIRSATTNESENIKEFIQRHTDMLQQWFSITSLNVQNSNGCKRRRRYHHRK